MKTKLQVLTVIYHETEDHYRMAINAWKAFPIQCEITAVINKKFEGVEYPDNIHYIENDENCLSKAWNIGLKHIFQKHDIAFVSGLDSQSPTYLELMQMVESLEGKPKPGLVSATADGVKEYPVGVPVQHGDGSFSFFAIAKEAFEKVGNFDENFKPAYFEDNDYLERLWQSEYLPLRLPIRYFHVFQGTMKFGKESRTNYPVYMQKNLDYFKSKWHKVPNHLPDDIKFI